MPSSPPIGDPALLDRVLGTGPDPADAAAAQEAVLLARLVEQVALPPARLSGWSSLCADEYTDAVRRLRHVVALAAGALHAAGRVG